VLGCDVREGRDVCLAAVVVVPVAAPRRFFASATAPVPVEGRAARLARVLVPEPAPADPAVPVTAVLVAPTLGRGDAVAPAVTGFLAAAVVAAVVLLLTRVGEPAVLLAVDTRRAALVAAADTRGFFSSSDTDGCERWVEDVAGRFVAVAVPAGRVGGLLNPLVVLIRVEDAAVFAAAVVPATGRRAAVPAGATRFAGAAAAAGFASAVPLVGAGAVVAGVGSASAAGASPC